MKLRSKLSKYQCLKILIMLLFEKKGWEEISEEFDEDPIWRGIDIWAEFGAKLFPKSDYFQKKLRKSGRTQ